MTELLRTLPALDAVLLVCRLRGSPAVYLSPGAREGILAHLSSHGTELGGLLVGRAYVAGSGVPDTWGPLIAIDRVLPSETCRSSRVSLAMETEIWDRARNLMAHEGGMVVGWYHSHPNLGAFFSSTDRATQRAFFNQPYSVGLVVDPIRGEEAWFIGPRSTPLKIESVLVIGLTTMSSGRRNESTEKGKQ